MEALSEISSRVVEDERKGDIVVEYSRKGAQFRMTGRHRHPRFELYYLLNGQRGYFIRDQVHRVNKGDLVLIPSDELHMTSPIGQQGHERILVEFASQFLKPFLAEDESDDLLSVFAGAVPVYRPAEADRQKLEGLLARLLEEHTGLKAGSGLVVRSLLVEVLVLVKRIAAGQGPAVLDEPDSLHRTIGAVSRYVTERYALPLSLDALARRFAISPAYLSRSFSRVTGMCLGDYIATVRIREARRLLSTTGMGIEGIAEACGFSCAASFGRVFRAETGMAPRRWRQCAPRPEDDAQRMDGIVKKRMEQTGRYV